MVLNVVAVLDDIGKISANIVHVELFGSHVFSLLVQELIHCHKHTVQVPNQQWFVQPMYRFGHLEN